MKFISLAVAALVGVEARHHHHHRPHALMQSDPICSSAGCTQYKHEHKKLPYDINYPVPSFGADPDMAGTADSIKIAEDLHKHELVWDKDFKKKFKNPAKDVLYDDKPDLDSDMITTRRNIKRSENRLGQKMELVQMQSDPICSSAGCTQYKHPKKELGYELDYFVPNFGADPDMTATTDSLAIAENQLNHKLVWDKKFKKKWENPAKDVLYDDAPVLDGDIKASQKNLKNAENTYGHDF